MSEYLSRVIPLDLEVRADSTGRTVTGIVVPFERVARVSDGGPSYDEKFRMGAFERAVANGGAGRVRLLQQHNQHLMPLGCATLLREDRVGLYGEFRVSNTTDGNNALELIRDGVIDSFSVGFTPVKHVMEGGVKVRTDVKLREVSVVTFPAYADAVVTGIRAELLGALSDEQVQSVLAALNLRATTPDEDSEHDPATTPLADSEPSALRAHVIAWNNFRASLTERGIR